MDRGRLKLDGSRFSKEPLSEDELAQFRELSDHYETNFRSTDELLDETGLAWFASVAKGFPTFLRLFLTAGALTGALAAIKGWIPWL